jgi:hypothetical protein
MIHRMKKRLGYASPGEKEQEGLCRQRNNRKWAACLSLNGTVPNNFLKRSESLYAQYMHAHFPIVISGCYAMSGDVRVPQLLKKN